MGLCAVGKEIKIQKRQRRALLISEMSVQYSRSRIPSDTRSSLGCGWIDMDMSSKVYCKLDELLGG